MIWPFKKKNQQNKADAIAEAAQRNKAAMKGLLEKMAEKKIT